MKINSLLFGFAVGLMIMVVLPYIFISFNDASGFPIYSNYLFKTTGLLLITVGVILFAYCSQLFKLIGKGTPVPIEPPKELVVKGIYKSTRNPIYLSYWLIIFGEFLLFGHLFLLVYFFLFILVNHIYVVLVEEKELYGRFGKSYEKHIHNVPRYIPRLFIK